MTDKKTQSDDLSRRAISWTVDSLSTCAAVRQCDLNPDIADDPTVGLSNSAPLTPPGSCSDVDARLAGRPTPIPSSNPDRGGRQH